MTSPAADDKEPKPFPEVRAFEEWDFASLEPERAKNPEYNERRLSARRKLAALAKRAQAELVEQGLRLEPRTSLHNPHAFNHMRVTRIWAYLTRPKAEKTRLRRVLGPEIGKDLDAAYRNAYLCLAIEADALEVSLRIHPDGWFDGQNLVRRVKKEGPRALLALLNALPGYQLRLHDWKGEWRCGSIAPEWLDEYLKRYVPGEHSLAVEQRFELPRGAREAAPPASEPLLLVRELLRLAALYRYAAWSEESDFLFGS